MRFLVATDEEIRRGDTTDIYFARTRDILKRRGVDTRVYAEFTTMNPPYPWMVFAGLREIAHLFEGIPVTVRALPEGTIFTPRDVTGVPVPVMSIEGRYVDFAVYETPALGLICQATGIATKAARIKRAAVDKTVLSFGVRRMHPAIAPMIDFYSYIGGCDGVSSILGARALGVEPKGTMPHALILTVGEREAWKDYEEDMPPEVPRIALIDTLGDEKFKALEAAEVMENIYAVRLDTPSSRRGNFADLVREVRWELDLRGHRDVKIIVSGGIDERAVEDLRDIVDGFGVGTSISNARTVDFAMDIVEVEGKPLAKRGKFSGRKDVYRCEECLAYRVVPSGSPRPTCDCGAEMRNIVVTVVKDGEVAYDFPSPQDEREYVLSQLRRVRE